MWHYFPVPASFTTCAWTATRVLQQRLRHATSGPREGFKASDKHKKPPVRPSEAPRTRKSWAERYPDFKDGVLASIPRTSSGMKEVLQSSEVPIEETEDAIILHDVDHVHVGRKDLHALRSPIPCQVLREGGGEVEEELVAEEEEEAEEKRLTLRWDNVSTPEHTRGRGWRRREHKVQNSSDAPFHARWMVNELRSTQRHPRVRRGSMDSDSKPHSPSLRQLRFQELLRKALQTILHDGSLLSYGLHPSDSVYLHDVEVSRDLRYANVFWSSEGERMQQKCEKILARAQERIRMLLAAKIYCKYVPEIRFKPSEDVRHEQMIEQALSEWRSRLKIMQSRRGDSSPPRRERE